jgi:hypothetical protein
LLERLEAAQEWIPAFAGKAENYYAPVSDEIIRERG